jgi:trans-aconitate methyltransferase
MSKPGLLWKYYRYPQYEWASVIHEQLRSLELDAAQAVIDAPCGDGIVSFWLRRKLPAQKIVLNEMDEALLAQAGSAVARASVVPGDIHQLEVAGSDNVWLFVNSLYLLPKPEHLLRKLSPSASVIIGVFPYLDHPNYRSFQRAFPDFDNCSAMTEQETDQLFAQAGFALAKKVELTAIAYHGLRVPYCNFLITRILNLVSALMPRRRCAYWLGVYQRLTPVQEVS